MTQEMINEFAELTDDHQWIHVDVERARSGPFGGPIAHGLLTVSLMPRIAPPMGFELVGYGAIVNYGCEGFRFLVPVRAGSTIRAHSRLLDVRKHERGSLLATELAVHVAGNDRPSLVYKGLLLYTPASA